MLRQLIDTCRQAELGHRPCVARPRWRPALEQLESRLAPSLAPLPIHADNAAPQKAASSERQQLENAVALFQSFAIRQASPAAAPVPTATVPPRDVSVAPASVANAPAPALPLDLGFLVLPPEESPGVGSLDNDSLDGAIEPSRIDGTFDATPPIEVVPPPSGNVPPAADLDHAGYIVETVAQPCDAAWPTPATPAVQEAPAAAQGDLPLFVWLVGMTCIVATRWEFGRDRTAAMFKLSRRERTLLHGVVGA